MLPDRLNHSEIDSKSCESDPHACQFEPAWPFLSKNGQLGQVYFCAAHQLFSLSDRIVC